MGKGFRGCALAFILSTAIIPALLLGTIWFWPEFWGVDPLGKYLYLEYFEENRVLVLGDEPQSSFFSSIGQLIPTMDHTFEETIVDVDHNKEWVILKSLVKSDSLYRYYIIDKSFDDGATVQKIQDEYIYSFPGAESFEEECCKRGIDLHFKTQDKPGSRRRTTRSSPPTSSAPGIR